MYTNTSIAFLDRTIGSFSLIKLEIGITRVCVQPFWFYIQLNTEFMNIHRILSKTVGPNTGVNKEYSQVFISGKTNNDRC